MLGSKYIDMKKDENVQMVRYALGASFTLVATVYFFIYTSIKSKKDTKEIWVPPKPAPALPFSTPPPKPTPDKFEKTTYAAYEEKEIFDAAKSAAMSFGIALIMSLKFNIHISCLLQAAVMPLR